MVKIHILGGPGSGKSTLAQCLSSTFHVPHYDLDTIGWKNGDRMAAYIDDAISIAEQPGWVTEGIYLIWTDPLLYQADYIVLLEISWPVAAWRIIRRHISKSLRGTNPYPSIKLLFKLLKYTRSYYKDKVSSDRPTAESACMYIEEHGDSAEPPHAERLLMHLETYRISIPPTAAFVHIYLETYKEKVLLVKNNADRERLLALFTKR